MMTVNVNGCTVTLVTEKAIKEFKKMAAKQYYANWRRNLDKLSTEMLNKMSDGISAVLNKNFSSEVYEVYSDIDDELTYRWRHENEGAYYEWYEANIKGKTVEQLDDAAYSMWSDYHKDIFGFRPRPTRGEIL